MTLWHKGFMVLGAVIAMIGFVSFEILPESRVHGVFAIAIGVVMFVASWTFGGARPR